MTDSDVVVWDAAFGHKQNGRRHVFFVLFVVFLGFCFFISDFISLADIASYRAVLL